MDLPTISTKILNICIDKIIKPTKNAECYKFDRYE